MVTSNYRLVLWAHSFTSLYNQLQLCSLSLNYSQMLICFQNLSSHFVIKKDSSEELVRKHSQGLFSCNYNHLYLKTLFQGDDHVSFLKQGTWVRRLPSHLLEYGEARIRQGVQQLRVKEPKDSSAHHGYAHGLKVRM